MSYPSKKLNLENSGISKNEAHVTLQQMEEQLRFIDQKLKVHVDREVWIHFQNEIHQIDFTKTAIEKMRA